MQAEEIWFIRLKRNWFHDPQNSEFEELLIPVAVRRSFEHLDLVVGSFHGPRGYGKVVPSQDASSVRSHGCAATDSFESRYTE